MQVMNRYRSSRFRVGILVILPALAALLTTGCAEQQILDETGLATIFTADLLENGMIRGTILIPVINPDAQEKIQIASAVGRTIRSVRDQINLQLDKRLLSGQLRVTLYSDKLAKQGIIGIVDTLYRDPSIASRMYLGVYEGETNQLLTYPFKEEGNIGMYLYRLIEQNVEQEKIPSATLHEFLRAYFSQGSDPYLPYFVKKGDEIMLKGIALFYRDKLKGVASPQEAFFIKLIRDLFEAGSYETSIPRRLLGLPEKKNGGGHENRVDIVLDTISSESKIKLVGTRPPKFEIKIKFQTRILEMSDPIDIANQKTMTTIQQEVEKEMVASMQKLMKKLQKLTVDPIGFGEIYLANQPGARKLSHEELHKLFKQATFRFRVEGEIIRSGTTD